MGILSAVLGAILLLILSGALYSGFSLFRNYLAARKIGVPVRIILFDHVNPLWLVCDRAVLSLVKRLPFGLGNNSFTRYNYRGWEVPDRYYSHHEMGDAYILVSPSNTWLYIADPDAVTDMWRRAREFPRDVSVTGEPFHPDCLLHPSPFSPRPSGHLELIANSDTQCLRSKYIHRKGPMPLPAMRRHRIVLTSRFLGPRFAVAETPQNYGFLL